VTGLRQAAILAGGRGTRLRALAATTTKLLLPIAGETSFLDTLIENILLHGITDIVLPAGHLGKAVEAPYTGVSMRGAKNRVIRESQPLGTGGALRGAAAHLDDVLLMTNGDSALDINYLALGAALGPQRHGRPLPSAWSKTQAVRPRGCRGIADRRLPR